MPLFRGKRIKRPKNPLGIALYQYDKITGKELKGILKTLSSGKSISPERASAVLDSSIYKLDYILEDISKENLKIDYRSDKTRYDIIDMINTLKTFFDRARDNNFDGEKISQEKTIVGPDKIHELREALKKKMQDIESDYL